MTLATVAAVTATVAAVLASGVRSATGTSARGDREGDASGVRLADTAAAAVTVGDRTDGVDDAAVIVRSEADRDAVQQVAVPVSWLMEYDENEPLGALVDVSEEMVIIREDCVSSDSLSVTLLVPSETDHVVLWLRRRRD
jgi:hypothetical protein